MLKIEKVTIKNFLSVGNVPQTIDLTVPGVALVLGRNAELGPTAKNGCGKSTFIQAISYGLYGEPLTEIKVGNLINDTNQKALMVTVEFSKNGVSYRVERGRKPTFLRFFIDNKNTSSQAENDEAQGENKHTQAEIDRIIGMSHLLFQHLVALNTFTEPFIKMKAAPQREVIEELLGYTQISERDEILQKHIKTSKEVIRDEEVSVNAIQEANSRINRAIDRTKEEANVWNISKNKKLETLKQKIDDLSSIDFDIELAVFDLIDEWKTKGSELRIQSDQQADKINNTNLEAKTIRNEIARIRSTGSTNYDAQISRLEAEARRLETDAGKSPDAQVARLRADIERREKDAAAKIRNISAKEKELVDISDELDNADGHTCTTCGQGLSGTDHLDQIKSNLQNKLNTIVEEIAKYEAEENLCQKQISEIELEIENLVKSHAEKQQELSNKAVEIHDEIKEIRKQQAATKLKTENEIAELQEALAEIEGILDTLTKELNDIKNKISLHKEQQPVSDYNSREEIWRLREDKNKLNDEFVREQEKQNPHETQIETLKETLQAIDYTTLNEAIDTLKHQEFLHKLLTAKDSFVRKKIIDQNLAYLNGRMNKYLEALGLPHEVRFLPDLTVNISKMGKEYNFPQLSRGQQGRVILATSWAFRDVWESSNTSINLCICDELLDNGLDEHGVDLALEVLGKMSTERGKNVFLISHKESLIGTANRILIAHFENNFTTYEDDGNF